MRRSGPTSTEWWRLARPTVFPARFGSPSCPHCHLLVRRTPDWSWRWIAFGLFGGAFIGFVAAIILGVGVGVGVGVLGKLWRANLLPACLAIFLVIFLGVFARSTALARRSKARARKPTRPTTADRGSL